MESGIKYGVNQHARRSNLRHRPIGLGVQGLADVFALLDLPFDGPEARRLNLEIFETIYFAALETSCALAEVVSTTGTKRPAACSAMANGRSRTRWAGQLMRTTTVGDD